MPWMTPHPCRHPGCGNLVRGAGGQCSEHRGEARRRADELRPSAAARGYDRDWQELRRRHLEENPDCVECGDPATQVDHKVPIAAGGARLDPANLQSMCTTHHSVKTGKQDRPRHAASGAR